MRAVAYLVAPTVFTQIISILYNLADTYFIGQLGDPVLVAAVGVRLPPMMILTALANLFGVGVSSIVSRALGRHDENNAANAAGFALWAGIITERGQKRDRPLHRKGTGRKGTDPYIGARK